MDEAMLNWTILVTIVSAGWVLTIFIRDRVAQSVALSSALVTRLLEYDILNIENPSIQKFISENAKQDDEWFRSNSLLSDDIFYKAKTLAYNQLNLFDEISSVSSNTSGRWFLLRPAPVVELSDWYEYMIEKLRHPLYRSILKHENHIFGASLRDFWDKNRVAIESKDADPFIW